WDSEPTNITPLKIYTSVTTNNSTTTMKSDYVWLLSAYPACSGLEVEYQNTSSGAFRGRPTVTCQAGPYGLHVE
ncbi:hypothetical protein BGZ98_006588, partial [Dissophora globulifera]